MYIKNDTQSAQKPQHVQNVNLPRRGMIKIFINNFFWGFILWLFGYLLNFIFYTFIPGAILGWSILPFSIIFTIWILVKKIKREELKCYFGVGLVWLIMAIILDYVFIVKFLNLSGYYRQIDIIVYYILIFFLPIIIGWRKFKKERNGRPTFMNHKY